MTSKPKWIWINGKFISYQAAKVPILNHSLHYGSAVFEGVRCYKTSEGPAIFKLKEHIDRLFHSAEVMGMRIPYAKKEIISATMELVKKNKLKECYIRPLVFYGEKMGLLPLGAPLHVAIAAWPWGKYLDKNSIAVKIVHQMRIHPKSSVMTAKIAGHYSNSILAALEAKKAGCDEALLLDWNGNIAEGPGENIFFVKGNILYTPQKSAILPGITRNSVMAMSKGLGFSVVEKNIKPRQLKTFDESFFVGTAVEVNAIGKIDGIIFGDGKEGRSTKIIREAYLDVVHGKSKKYRKWLSLVK